VNEVRKDLFPIAVLLLLGSFAFVRLMAVAFEGIANAVAMTTYIHSMDHKRGGRLLPDRGAIIP
jgi:hypothetical protein